MHKRIISTVLVFLMCLSVWYTPVLAATDITATYSLSTKKVEYTGTGFEPSTVYIIRITGPGVATMLQTISDGSGGISASETVGVLAAGTYMVYVDKYPSGPDNVANTTLTIGFPTAPQNLAAAPGDGKVTLTWTAPLSDGGSAITGYEVSSDNGSTWTSAGSALTYTATGLSNGTEYTFVVRAVNANGNGANATVTATPSSGLQQTYAVTVNSSPSVGGSVTGGGSYAENSTVNLTAAPSANYSFSGWTSNDITIPNPSSTNASFTMPAKPVTVTANFTSTVTGGGTPGGGGGSGGGGGGGGGGGSSSGGTTTTTGSIAAATAATGTGTVYLNGTSISITTNSDGSVTLKNSDITSFGGKQFILGLPHSVLSGQNANAYVGVKIVNGQTVILPLSAYKSGNANMMISEAGTYGVMYNPKNFSDASGHWAADNIMFVAARGLYAGVGDGKFDPNGSMTRSMFATVLSRLDGADLSGYGSSRFTDVPEGKWYTGAVEWAAKSGIVSGVGDNRFDPDATITREQMAVMLARYIESKGYSLPSAASGKAFSDNAEISPWAKDAVERIQRAGIITGKQDNLFDPKGTATRAEVATVFTKFVSALLG